MSGYPKADDEADVDEVTKRKVEADDEADVDEVTKVVRYLQTKNKVLVLSGAGMSTAAGIPDFRSPGGLYGTTETLLDRFTYCGSDAAIAEQKHSLTRDVKNALTHKYFQRNPLAYHEMRRGMIIGLGENQWKYTIGHVFPEILNRMGKLHLLASQNIDGLDHKVIGDKSKLYNPHGLMSTLVSEDLVDGFLATSVSDPVYQKYVQLVKDNIKDIYADRPARQGKSHHLWPSPPESTPITLAMFGDLLPERFQEASDIERNKGIYSVKPGSVLFDRQLWRTNAAGEPCNAFDESSRCDLMMVMGTSLSGLTIDELAHSATVPRIVFDIGRAPVDSIASRSGWRPHKDCFLEGPIDSSIIDILFQMEWLDQIFDFLPHLCLGSLKLLEAFVADQKMATDVITKLGDEIESAIRLEVERERAFYGDE